MKDEEKTKAYLVLVIEDQELFREYLEQVLRDRGYCTISFGEPFRALDYFIHNPEQVDLILTDVVMPYMDGIELTKRIAKVKRGTPVILLSAYSEQLIHGASLPNVKAVLDKPVLRNDLIQAIEDVIPSHGNRRGAKQL